MKKRIVYNKHMTCFLIKKGLWSKIKKKAKLNDIYASSLINILLRYMFKNGIFPYVKRHKIQYISVHYKLGGRYAGSYRSMKNAFQLRMEVDRDNWIMLELFSDINGVSKGLALNYILEKSLEEQIEL